MHQEWLQVVGLVMDFAGVMLLAGEWLVGYFAQQREERIERQGEQELKNLSFAQQSVRDKRMAAHLRMVAARTEQRVRDQGSEVRRQSHQVRLPVFVCALALIAGGFLLQIAGSWPGGLPAIGVLAN